MGDVLYNNKIYQDVDANALRAFRAMNIYTFRYYPGEKLWVASDDIVEAFGTRKFYHILNDEDGPNVIYSKDRDKDRMLYKELVTDTSKDTISATLRFRGGDAYCRVTLAVLERDENKRPKIIAGMLQDYDEELRKSAYMNLLSDDYYSVIDVDLDNNKFTPLKLLNYIENVYGADIRKSDNYEDMIAGYIEHEVIPEERADMLHITSLNNLEKLLKDTNVYRHDYRVLRNGEPHFIRIKVVKLNEGDELHRMLLGFAEVSHDTNTRLEQLAYHDQVTLGRNYNYFAERLKDEKNKGYIISVDIRDFRLINDVCGVATGDNVLRDVNSLIEKSISAKSFSAHVNGDHFVIFVPVKSEEAVIKVMDKITAGFGKIVEKNDIPKISPYYGAAKWTPGDRIQIMFGQANFAKHRIKNDASASYGFYRDEDNAREIEQKSIEEAFEGAIAGEQFEIWYQPKYSPIEKELSGAEALVRWRKPDGSLVPPGKFIPIYEKNGMIRKLDEYVFLRVCKQQRKWINEFGRTIPVSINLSRASLFYENIVEEYKKIANEVGILPELVPIEITESAAISNSDIKEISDRFYAAGFPLHIDDFGTGYSSMSTLNLMRFDTLKLDKSLIDYIGEFGGDRLVKHTVALAKDMGLYVTAEGVEKEEQVAFLKEINCDSIQGFLYSKPVPADEFERKLTEERICEKFMYQSGMEHPFTKIVENIRRACSDAAVERVKESAVIQINLTGNTEGVCYIKFDNGKAEVQPYEYNDRDARIRIDAFTLLSILKGIGTLENAIRTGRVGHEGSWKAIEIFDRIVRK